jgi:glycine cleavage system H protein
MNLPKTSFPVYPPEEVRCVWMTAGVLAYRLCDAGFECESCALDAGMRAHRRNEPSQRQDPAQPGNRSESRAVPATERRYTTNHCWTLPVRRCVLRIGIVPALSRVLQDPRSIVLPMRGQRLERDQSCAWFVMDGGTLALRSPVSGIVSRVNGRIAGEPHIVNADPLGGGWLYEIEWTSRSVEAPLLLTADEAASIYESEAGRFRESLLSALARGGHPVGATLADGGQMQGGLPGIVGPTRYLELLGRAFSMH